MQVRSGFNQVISEDLVVRAQHGDVDAFEQLYRDLSGASYTLAYRICGHHVTAEDIVHEAFIKVMKSIKGYQHAGSFAGWCRKIVTHEAINRVKQTTRLQLVDDEEIDHNENHLFTNHWLDDCIDIDRLTAHLKPLQRAVFFLHEVEGYNHKEVAQFFDKSESFSKVTLYRSYELLKQLAEKECQERQYAPK